MKKYLQLAFCATLFLGASHFSNAQLGKCKGKYFGNIVAYSVPSNYTGLWNQTTSENGSKWGTVHRGTNNYSWGNSDLAYNTAKNSGGAFKFHALIWGGQAPSFLANSSPSQIETAIRQWYQAVQDHYTPMGGLNFIDVLNEPVNTPINKEIPNLKAALTLGFQNENANANDKNNPYGWAIWPFQLARKHFPNATLLINEFNVEHNWNNCRAEYIRMSNAIKNAPNLTDGKKNLIDGIGLQAHGIETLSATAWKNCIDQVYNDTQLPIHITEFDLAADPNEAHQRTKFQEFITIAWEHPRVAGITLWGYIQGSTWRPGNGVTGASGTDTGIMYANGNDRPAMAWLRTYLAGRPSLSCCPAPAPFASCNGSNAPTVSITAPANNASFTAPATINITATATDADGTVSKVEFFNGTTKLGEDASSPYAYAWANVVAGTYSITAKATDNSGNATTSTITTVKVNAPQGPYNGVIHQIPGTIQAEHFDVGGNGFAYNDDSPGSAVTPVVNFRTTEDVDIENCTDAGTGYNIGYWTAGEWLEYTVNVANTGPYDLDLRVAADGTGRTVSLTVDGANLASNITIPNTAGWQAWTTVTTTVQLTAGQHILRITAGATSYINFNYMQFKPANITGLEGNEMAGFSLYPNPFTSEGLHVKMQGEFNYRIADVSGAIMENGIGKEEQALGKQLMPGVYFITIEQNNANRTYKIVRQ
jgi:GH35 family endo-1,4-beta-xylanase